MEEEEGVQEDGKGPQQRSRKAGTKGGRGSGGAEDDEEDLEQFMQEIDADKEMRRNINIYKKRGAVHAQAGALRGDSADRSDGNWDEEEVS